MKKRILAILAAFTTVFNLFGIVHGNERVSQQNSSLHGVKDSGEVIPLYLDDAVKAIKNKDCGCAVLGHVSHSSHASHASHFSHYSARPR